MLIDPHIACIRVPRDNGLAFYEGVMRRVANRSAQPHGVTMHWTAAGPTEFQVNTVFRDNDAMLEGFLQFSAPEAQNEMLATGWAVDMTRETYELERVYVEQDVESNAFSLVLADGITACTSEFAAPKRETYNEIVERGGWFSESVPGRIAHVAYTTPSGLVATTFWRSRELGQRWYEEHLYEQVEELEPGSVTPEGLEASWLELHSFLVLVDQDDPQRHFVRTMSGPTSV